MKRLGPPSAYGSSGIPRQGKEVEYATASWRECPTAFWLHPEGPLSDSTPDEYFANLPDEAPVDQLMANCAASGLLHSGSAMAAYQNAYNSALAYQQYAANQYGLSNYNSQRPGSVLGSLLGSLV